MFLAVHVFLSGEPTVIIARLTCQYLLSIFWRKEDKKSISQKLDYIC